MARLVHDIHCALRALRKSPAFTIVMILTLTLCIGANTAIFSLIDALLLRKLPVQHPQELMQLIPVRLDGPVLFSFPMFREVARGQKVFSGLIGWSPGGMVNVEIDGALGQDNVMAVTGNYYSVLGASPYLGRLIQPPDASLNSAAAAQIAVLGYDFWKRRFGASPSIIGHQIRIEGQPFTVVGVTRRWFTGMSPGEPPEIVIPLTAQPLIQSNSNFLKGLEDRSFLWLYVVGRLDENATISQARAQLQSIWPEVLASTAPTQAPGSRLQRWLSMSLDIRSAAIGIAPELRDQFTRPLYVLFAIAALILLAACVNLASLMLARGAARSHEMSVRLAIGATGWLLARQVLVENLALAVGGASLGLLAAYWAGNLLAAALTRFYETPVLIDLRPDLHIIGVTTVVAIATGLLFGIAPALSASHSQPISALRENSQSLSGGPRLIGKSLIVIQIGLSFVLLIGAVLLARTFQKLNSLDLGIEKENLVEVTLSPKPNGYQNLDMNAYHRQVAERVSGIAGVRSVSFSDVRLPRREGWRDIVSPTAGDTSGPLVDATMVAPLFLQTLGIRLVDGRDFDWIDDEHHPPVAIVSRSLSERLFQHRQVIGRHIRFGVFPEFQSLEIVGVAEDARVFDIRNSSSFTLYLPNLQHAKFALWGNLFIRTGVLPGAFLRTATRAIESLGHEYVLSTLSVSEVTSELLVTEQATAVLSGIFAGLAVLMACVGLYGLMAFTITRRSREIGIRSALGAKRSDILSMLLREATTLSLLGIAFGVACSLVTNRLLASMLFGLSPTDLPTILLVSFVLFTVSLLAAYLPMRQAMAIDPIEALRYE